MNHSTKSAIEYTVFGIGMLVGIFVCVTPLLANAGWISESFLFAKGFTPIVGLLIIGATFAWGYWAHQQCKKGVCELPAGSRHEN